MLSGGDLNSPNFECRDCPLPDLPIFLGESKGFAVCSEMSYTLSVRLNEILGATGSGGTDVDSPARLGYVDTRYSNLLSPEWKPLPSYWLPSIF